MNYKIKRFNELNIEELYKILELRSKVFVVEQECPYQDCDGKDKNSYHLFCEENDKVIAVLRIIDKGISYKEVSIGRVSVDMDYRGKGYAGEMMTKAIDFIKEELKETEIKIQAQAYLINFYKSFGFQEVSEIYLEDDIPHVDMLYKSCTSTNI